MNRKSARASKASGRRLIRQGWNPFVEGPDPKGTAGSTKCWRNNLYIVMWVPPVPTMFGPMGRIMIRRNDESTHVRWAHKQRIENELFGPHRIAIEIFPAEGELVDDANLYHLWILPEGHPAPARLTR